MKHISNPYPVAHIMQVISANVYFSREFCQEPVCLGIGWLRNCILSSRRDVPSIVFRMS